MKIPDNTKIQSVDLKVKNLERSLNFYSNLLGFKIISNINNTAILSAAGELPYLIKITEDKNAVWRLPGTTGLYHIAIKLPDRKELAKVFMRLFENKTKFQGFSDHLVSEAIYLKDPDEIGVELYSDRPRNQWLNKFGQIEMDTLPLDLSTLTAELKGEIVWHGIHPQTEIGHIHLNVSDLHKAQKFYSLLLGMNVTNSMYNGALFFSAGGYHHHIGTNIWSSKNGSPAPLNNAGLQRFTIKIPDEVYLKELEKRFDEAALLEKNMENGILEIIDFNKIKITLTL
ncbi:MAG: VOC family protein [Ignavibacteria bacterium]|nr:VOC family protein [Ignavibacteria bacterium]